MLDPADTFFVVCLIVKRFLTARIGALPRGPGRPNCSPYLFVFLGCGDVKAFFVALDALFFVSFLSSFFDVVFYLLSEPLGVDFELPNRPSDLQK